MSEKSEKVPSEFYRLVVTRRVYTSKKKYMDVKAVFDWENKDDALAVKDLLKKANKAPLDKKPIVCPWVEFKIVYPDEPL